VTVVFEADAAVSLVLLTGAVTRDVIGVGEKSCRTTGEPLAAVASAGVGSGDVTMLLCTGAVGVAVDRSQTFVAAGRMEGRTGATAGLVALAPAPAPAALLLADGLGVGVLLLLLVALVLAGMLFAMLLCH
jgi:hypothetical protein